MKTNSIYRRSQLGIVTVVFLLIGIGVVGFVAYNLVGGLLGVLALVCFYNITLEVDDKEVRFKLGAGLIKKNYPLDTIESVKSVCHPWYYGWGIRYLGEGWLWRVSGLHSVELALKGGKKVFIGIDDPNGAVAAIQMRLNKG